MRFLRWFSLLAVLVIGVLEPIFAEADTIMVEHRESVRVFGLTQQDLNGDGASDVTTIDCVFATALDRVLVYDRNGDMQAGDRWEAATDFEDDLWIFDAGADGSAQLIIAFARESGNQTAYLYVDENGDGQVSYVLSGKTVQVTESPHWRLKVTAEGAWLLPDGRPNPHVTVFIDGITQRLLDSYVGLTKGWLTFANDGQVDWEIESVDQDADGEADYVLTRLLTDIPDYFSAFRSSLVVDLDPSLAQPEIAPIFWPYLFGAEGADLFAKTPAVVLDWGMGTIREASVLGFRTEQSYDILSSAPSWRKGQVNDVLWENPKAYYDLASDRDGQSEMYIRVVQPLRLNAIPDRPLSADQLTIQYFWDQDDDRRYDYRVTVAGRKPFTHTINLADFAVRTVPYEALPFWVGEQKWDAAFLLVGEAGGQGGGEGLMWTWGDWNGLATYYLAGHTDEALPASFREIEAGYRGEYSLAYAQQPVLYFSPLDRRLHLRAAQDGVWNLGERRTIRYANLDGDAHLDQWQEERDGAVVQQLNYHDGVYVYGGNGEVRVRQTGVGPALFETQPPKNNEEWRWLAKQLGDNQGAFSAGDFAGMLGQLPGRETHIRGATLRDYRLTSQGFRFILELAPGFEAGGDRDLLASLPASAGTYAVSYDGAAWSARPATPALLRAGDLQATAQDGELAVPDWAVVAAAVRNDGLEDVRDLPLCLTFDGPEERRTVMTATLTLLPGEGVQEVAWDWAPPAAGDWQVRLIASCDGAAEPVGEPAVGKVLAETVVQVAAPAKPSASWLITLGGRVRESVVLFLAATVTLAGAAAAAWARRTDA